MEVLRATGDATLDGYRVMFDRLVLALRLWDESEQELVAEGVNLLVDEGTHEVDGIVRVPELDASDGRLGYGLIDTDGRLTLRFRAAAFDYEAGG